MRFLAPSRLKIPPHHEFCPMKRQIFLYFIRILSLFSFAAFCQVACSKGREKREFGKADIFVDGKPYTVEVALTDDERALGLMHRREMNRDTGMLFVFKKEDIRYFYMKNTLIPLSIAFINQKGRVVDIQDMRPLTEETTISRWPARYALEVNRGAFEEWGVEVGDTLGIPALLK